MLNVNPTNSSKLAQSIQRDYQQSAEAHHLAKANKKRYGTALTKSRLTTTTIIIVLTLIVIYIA